MEWQVLVALVVCIVLCLLPVIMAWHHYFGGIVHIAHKKKTTRTKNMTVKAAGMGA